ncbi:MAG: RES family NAD+ phosphorylase [Planctomycetia bacterium]|nr:RES family NAD+ phosphorylase [Planctomycetia bacterium]
MLPPPALRTALARIPPREYRTRLFRAVNLKYLKKPRGKPLIPLFDQASVSTGARFTPQNTGPRTLYLAEDPATAYYEANWEELRRTQDQPHTARPPVTAILCVGAEFGLMPILDLTLPEVRAVLGTTLTEIQGIWVSYQAQGVLSPTQSLGQEVFNHALYHAIRYPSVRNPGGICLAVFTQLLAHPERITLDDSAHSGLQQTIP